jgi:hypothetical protein
VCIRGSRALNYSITKLQNYQFHSIHGAFAKLVSEPLAPAAFISISLYNDVSPNLRRRDGRVAEGARLESVFRGNSNVGSNPTLSASSKYSAEHRLPSAVFNTSESLLLVWTQPLEPHRSILFSL